MAPTGHSRRLFWLFATTFLFIVTLILQPVPAQSQVNTTRPLDLLLGVNRLDLLATFAPAPSTATVPTPQVHAAGVARREPPAWGRIAFQSYRDSHWDIYISKYDGTEQKRLTDSRFVNVEPALARGGERLLFLTNRVKRDRLSLHLMNSDGSNLRALTNGTSDGYPSWAPNGYQIAFESEREENIDLYRINVDQTGFARLTDATGYDGQPSWSPDGTQIIFTSNRSGVYSLWRMNADGTNQVQLTNGAPALFPAWSPKGDRIAFAADTTGDGFLEIWQMDVNGRNFQKLVDNTPQHDMWQPTWAPDATWLAYQFTAWTKEGERWVWTGSFLRLYDLNEDQREPISDGQVWRPQWVSLDASAPNTCTPNVANQQKIPSFLVGLSATDVGPAGVTAYQVAARPNATSPWQPLAHIPEGPGIIYHGKNGERVEFRCRARDDAGNWANWTETPITAVTIDATLPQSALHVSAPRVRGNQVQVQWRGIDWGGAIAHYDIWSQTGTEGVWQRWQNDVTTTNATFTGEVGKVYAFRSQAKDQSGNLEPWQPAAQATVLFYTTQLTATVTDNRGYPVRLSAYQLEPTPAAVTPITPTTDLHFYLGNNPSHQLTIKGNQAASLPAARLTTTTDSTVQWVFPPSDEHLVNGGFEASLTPAWQSTGDGIQRVPTGHTGEYALQMQRTASGTTMLQQRVHLSATMNAPTLSWLQQSPDGLTGAGLVVNIQSAITTTTVYTSGTELAPSEPEKWHHHWVDLTPFQGETITITFALSNSIGTLRLDELSVGAWETSVARTVTPTTWHNRAPITLTVTGANFITPTAIYLGKSRLNAVTIANPNTLSVVVPAGIAPGTHDLIISNGQAPSSLLASAVTVDADQQYLPLVARGQGSQPIGAANADWPMLGYNVARTAYNTADPGASRYTLAWETAPLVAGGLPRISLSAVGDTVVATAGTSNVSIIAFDAYTGAIRWRKDRAGKPGGISGPSIVYHNVYYMINNHSDDTFILVDDLATGEERWRAPVYPQWQLDLSPLVVGNQLFTNGGYTGGVQAFDAGSGAEEWFVFIENYEDHAITFGNGQLYAESRRGLYGINPNTGEITLSNSGVGFGRNSFPIFSYPYVVIAGSTVVDLRTNTIVRQFIGSLGNRAVVDEQSILYRINNEAVEAIRLGELTPFWSLPIKQDPSPLTPPISYVSAGAGNYLYASSEKKTFVIDRRLRQVVDELDYGGISIVANGYLYIATEDMQIHAFQAQQP